MLLKYDTVTSEWLSLTALFRTADIGVHVTHKSRATVTTEAASATSEDDFKNFNFNFKRLYSTQIYKGKAKTCVLYSNVWRLLLRYMHTACIRAKCNEMVTMTTFTPYLSESPSGSRGHVCNLKNKAVPKQNGRHFAFSWLKNLYFHQLFKKINLFLRLQVTTCQECIWFLQQAITWTNAD